MGNGIIMIPTIFHGMTIPLDDRNQQLKRDSWIHRQNQRLNRIQNKLQPFSDLSTQPIAQISVGRRPQI